MKRKENIINFLYIGFSIGFSIILAFCLISYLFYPLFNFDREGNKINDNCGEYSYCIDRRNPDLTFDECIEIVYRCKHYELPKQSLECPFECCGG